MNADQFGGAMSRDPARIPELLEILRTAWEANSDLRLGQLLQNAARADEWSSDDLFYCEDDRLIAGFKKLLRRKKSNR